MFQFTHPGKGATWRKQNAYNTPEVSIHAPWEGCDLLSSVRFTAEDLFQFTHPGKGATTYRARYAIAPTVSIHAPWEGCDYRFNPFRLLAYQFQFTHPGKGATSLALQILRSRPLFQFTHPGKGATVRTHRRRHNVECFNSRTLGRVRRPYSPHTA